MWRALICQASLKPLLSLDITYILEVFFAGGFSLTNTSINLTPLFFKGRECKLRLQQRLCALRAPHTLTVHLVEWGRPASAHRTVNYCSFTSGENLKVLPTPSFSIHFPETGTFPLDASEAEQIMGTLPWWMLRNRSFTNTTLPKFKESSDGMHLASVLLTAILAATHRALVGIWLKGLRPLYSCTGDCPFSPCPPLCLCSSRFRILGHQILTWDCLI